ncbi:MAG: DUF2330 domain-containing protein [Sandaracinaceae bacterium]
MRAFLLAGVCGLTIVLTLVPTPAPVEACAAVWDQEAPVRITGEEALIVWDPEQRTEHFIRRAGFAGATSDFGFLVPTPSQPTLHEADAQVFTRLFRLYRRPRPVRRSRTRSRLRSAEVDDPWVHVVERRTVAGLDTSVLAANDAGALNGWLGEHGYPSSAGLQRWLERYVAEGWFVTAFRYDPADTVGAGFGSEAIRMTFQTDRPLFPYSEPRTRAPARPFRVSVIAPTRMRARLGRRRWRARVGYADTPGAASLRRTVGDVIPNFPWTDDTWLTVFDEPRSRRGSDDLFFEPVRRSRRVAPRLTRQIVLGAAAPAGGARRRYTPSGEGEVLSPW